MRKKIIMLLVSLFLITNSNMNVLASSIQNITTDKKVTRQYNFIDTTNLSAEIKTVCTEVNDEYSISINALRYAWYYNYYYVGWNTISVMNRESDGSYTWVYNLTFEILPSINTYVSKNSLEIYCTTSLVEYSLDGENWTEYKLFEKLDRKTKYTLYYRVKANDNFDAGTIQTIKFKTK